MPKRNYVPTEADALTGAAIRDLRQRRGETLKQTCERSNFGKDASTLAATERGERRLTEIEATALAAHFGTTADKILVKTAGPFHELWDDMKADRQQPATEQEWLGNEEPKPALFAVPDHTEPGPISDKTLTIFRDAPLSPDEYREQVWIPYLEQRYAQELKQTG